MKVPGPASVRVGREVHGEGLHSVRRSVGQAFLLAVTDFSPGEGVYPAEMVPRLSPRLGYRQVAAWDPGLHGWPR